MVTIIGPTQRSLSQQRVNVIDSTGTIVDNFAGTAIPYTIPAGATAICKGMNKSIAGAGGFDVWTPTGGTTGYIMDLYIDGGATNTFKIGDNVTDALADGTLYDGVVGYTVAAQKAVVIHFHKPLVIATKLRFYTATAGATNITVSFSGWEV